MRKLIALMAALFVAVPALAEEVVIAPPDTGSPVWNMIGYVLGVILVPIMTVLAKMALDWSATINAKKLDAQASTKDKFRLEAEKVLARIATNIANDQLAKAKEAAADGKVDKDELKKLGETAIAEAKEDLGPAIAKSLGDTVLKSILRKKVDEMKNGTK